MSLDGYISADGDNLDFLELGSKFGEDYGYDEFIKSVDTVIIGKRTYDWVMNKVDKFPHEDKETYIITHQNIPNQGNINFYNGNIKELVENLKMKQGKNIFCDGGAQIVNELLKHSLIDEFNLFVFPVLLGNGIKLFQDGRPNLELKLQKIKKYKSGVLEICYNC